MMEKNTQKSFRIKIQEGLSLHLFTLLMIYWIVAVHVFWKERCLKTAQLKKKKKFKTPELLKHFWFIL